MDIVKLTVTRNLLKYAVGRAITCRCGQIMDAKKAVLVDTTAVCSQCYDQVKDRIPAGTEVVDGRVLWARAPRVKKPAAPKVKRESFRGIYKAFIAGLVAQGCVLCPTCNAYLFPTHTHEA